MLFMNSSTPSELMKVQSNAVIGTSIKYEMTLIDCISTNNTNTHA